jgi:putative cofactor-binding repeat protein
MTGKNLIRFLLPILPILLLLSPFAATAVPTSHAVWYVSPAKATGLSGGSCNVPGFNTISAAVTAANPGDKITVCSGTYQEQVVITKSLTLIGSGSPTILAPATMAPDSFGYLNIVTITGSITASLSGFTVSGPVNVPCNTGIAGNGIFVQDGAMAVISGNTIESIHNAPIVQCAAYGTGIMVGRARLDTVGHAMISNDIISDYQKGGIIVDGTGSTAIIVHNTITGWTAGYQKSLSIQIAQNGIQISRGAIATVMFNTVSNNQCPIDNVNCGPNLITMSQATGILTYGAGTGSTQGKWGTWGTRGMPYSQESGTRVESNILTGNDVGLFVQNDTTFQDFNRISGSTFAGIVQYDGSGTYTASRDILAGNPIGIAVVSDGVSEASATTHAGYTGTFTSVQKDNFFGTDPIKIQAMAVSPGVVILKFDGYTYTISGTVSIS